MNNNHERVTAPRVTPGALRAPVSQNMKRYVIKTVEFQHKVIDTHCDWMRVMATCNDITDAQIVQEALEICHTYYDKVLDKPISAISEF